MLRYFAGFAAFFVAGAAYAGSGATRISGAPGGDVGCFVFDAFHPGVMLAGSSGGLIYRSTNGGASWTKVNVGLPTEEFRAIAQSPASQNTFFAYGTGLSTSQTGAFGSGLVYVSQDDGVTWARLANQPPASRDRRGFGRGIAIDKTGQIIVATDLQGGIFRSADAGQSWTIAKSKAFAVYGLAADPGDPNTLYAGGRHRNASGATQPVVLKSVDFGETWSTITSPAFTISGTSQSTVYAMAVQPGTGTVFATYSAINFQTGAQPGGVARSGDGGATWADDTSGLPMTFNPGSASGGIVFDPVTPSTVYLATNSGQPADGSGFFVSMDSGDHWAPDGQLLPTGGAFVAAARPAAAGYPAAVFAGFPSIAATTDSGKTWTTMTTGFNNAPLNVVVDQGKSNGYYAATENGVFKTADDGAVWTPTSVLPGYYPTAIATDVSKPVVPVYVVTPAGLFRSTSAGVSWTSIQPPVAQGLSVSYVLTDSKGDVFAVDSGHTVYRSSNEGAAWTEAAVGGSSDVFYFSTKPIVASGAPASSAYAGLMYAALYNTSSNSGELYVSRDRGATWTLSAAQLQPDPGYPTPPYILNMAIRHSQPYTLFVNDSDGYEYSLAPGATAFVSLSNAAPPPNGFFASSSTFLTAPVGGFAFNAETISRVVGSSNGFSTSFPVAASLKAFDSGALAGASATASALFLSDFDGASFVVPYGSLGN